MVIFPHFNPILYAPVEEHPKKHQNSQKEPYP
nr:MAG TPA: hypothetical protein [Caudoviricetes sp.]